MRIVSLRPFLLEEWRVCSSRCGMVDAIVYCSTVRFETVVEKTSYGSGCSSDNWVIFAKVLRKSEVL